jgi:hypothetical protein
MAAEVHLPLVGGVSKKALLIGGTAAAALVGFIYVRKRKSGASSTATDTGATDQYPPDGTVGDPSDPNSTDPATGMTYGDEGSSGGLDSTGLADELAASGYTDPNTGGFIFGNSGTGQAAATTNAAWAQNAIAYLGSNVSVDTALLSTALGAYLAGSPLTSDQEGLVDQAIAVEGYPPTAGAGGYPPGIREAGTASQGGTGGSGGGVTGSGGGDPVGGSGGSGGSAGGPITAIPSGLHVTHIYTNSAQVAWSKPSIPSGQGPLTGYTVECYDQGGHDVNGPFKVATSQLFGNIGGLKSKTKYHCNVWCDPAKTGGPHATVSFTTK